MHKFKFGDVLENGWAGEDNPTRNSIFIKKTKRYIYCVGFDGKEIEFYNDKDSRLKVIGSVVDEEQMYYFVRDMKDKIVRFKARMKQGGN